MRCSRRQGRLIPLPTLRSGPTRPACNRQPDLTAASNGRKNGDQRYTSLWRINLMVHGHVGSVALHARHLTFLIVPTHAYLRNIVAEFSAGGLGAPGARPTRNASIA